LAETPTSRPSILQLCAVDFTARHFLLPLMRAQRAAGFDVHLACAPGDYVAGIIEEGFPVYPIPFQRSFNLLAHARAAQWGAPAAPSAPHPTPATRPGVERYFREFLAEKIGRQLLPDLRKLSATVGITLADDADRRPWILDIREGALQAVTRNGRVPQCAYRLDTPTFGQIVSGRLAPQKAFFERRVDLEGDMETGLRLAFILAAFFTQYSYEIGED
jgi:predicted lipid carrier protein YhbT